MWQIDRLILPTFVNVILSQVYNVIHNEIIAQVLEEKVDFITRKGLFIYGDDKLRMGLMS